MTDDAQNSDAVWRRNEPDSPCIKVCMIHPSTGLCVGCHRTADEIAAWSRMDAAARRAVLAELQGRAEAAAAAKPRRTGRRRRRSELE